MNWKRFIKLGAIGITIVTITILFFVIPNVSAATGCFPDTNGHWAETFICWLKNNGISSGYPDGTYGPEDGVTRAEMSVFIKKVYDLAQSNDDDTLAGLSCSTDQIAKWNGSAWVCQNQSDLVRGEGTQFDGSGSLLIGPAGSVAPDDSQKFANVNVTAPKDGALLINGSLNLSCSGAIIDCQESSGNVHVDVDGTRYNRIFYNLDGGSVDDNSGYWNSSNSAYVPVSAGSYTVSLLVENSSDSTGSTHVWSGGINVLFVPYGGDGTTP